MTNVFAHKKNHIVCNGHRLFVQTVIASSRRISSMFEMFYLSFCIDLLCLEQLESQPFIKCMKPCGFKSVEKCSVFQS